ncbi:choice-of-anchor K domain-containing protein, partial [Vibrio sp. PP-XX7]
MGDSFTLGSFTHHNASIAASGDSLEDAILNLTFNVVIDGVTTEVSLNATLTHDETSNYGGNSADTVTISAEPYTIDVNGVTYAVSLDGFRQSNGQVVTTVATAEEQTDVFDIVAHIEVADVSSSDNILSGDLVIDAGADGLDHVIATDIHDENGHLVIHEDGSYSFTVNADLATSLAAGESKVVSYEYTVVDKDGDAITSTLNMT